MTITKPLMTLGTGLILLCACNKKVEDSAAPAIAEVLLNGSSGSITLDAEELVNVTARITDDQELQSVGIEIHESANGHSHKSTFNQSWVESKTVPLEGTDYKLEASFVVPLNVDPSAYHLVMTAIDKSGKQSGVFEQEFTVINSSRPVINLSNPLLNASTIISRGSTLPIQGFITDDSDLSNIFVTIKYPPGYSGDPEFYATEITLTGSNDTSWDFQQDGDLDIVIPADAKTGAYTMTIIALDNTGNSTKLEGEFNIEA